MISVEKVDPRSFREVIPLLRELLDARLPEAAWMRLGDQPWEREDDCCGYALMDGTHLVGFLGAVFSVRRSGGTMHPFCNLTSFAVKPGYREYSLFLVRPILRLRRYTITDLTPSEAVCRLLKQVGFRILDSRLQMLLPTPIGPGSVVMTHDPAEILAGSEPEEQRIVADHVRFPRCGIVRARRDRATCLAVYTSVSGGRFSYAHVHFVSNPAFFARWSGRFRAEIAARTRTPWVIIEPRFLPSQWIPAWVTLPFPWPKVYRSPDRRPDQIDNLYSELILLNLRTVPTRAEFWHHLIARSGEERVHRD